MRRNDPEVNLRHVVLKGDTMPNNLPQNLYVCWKRDQVRTMQKALDATWTVIVWGHAVYGSRFEKIVVDVPVWDMSVDEFERFKDYVDYLSTRLRPDGVLIDQGGYA